MKTPAELNFFKLDKNPVVDDVDVDWRGFGGRDLTPTHRKSS
jgi:hypothetical protein